MIHELNEKFLEYEKIIEEWKHRLSSTVKVPIYSSVDLRHGGYKIAAIDTNLYPAGFNNLCTTYSKECIISFKKHIEKYYGNVSKILIISEANTKNTFYVESLRCLISMLEKDGYEVRAGLVDEELRKDSIVLKGNESEVQAFRIERDGDKLRVGEFVPDFVISNNDFSTGVPKILEGISQPIDPSPQLGWHLRRKSDHFAIIEKLMNEFGALVGVDPWILHPLTELVAEVDFHKKIGMQRIADTVDATIEKLKVKFAEYKIDEEPFVFVKNDYGTYGMAIMTATSGSDILAMNADVRKKMRRGKSGVEVNRVIVQEGIPTTEIHDKCPVEPVIYLVGSETVGGFYRKNCERTIRENLNSRGMSFSKICFHQLNKDEHKFIESGVCSAEAMMRVYGTIASVCAIAAGYEYNKIHGR